MSDGLFIIIVITSVIAGAVFSRAHASLTEARKMRHLHRELADAIDDARFGGDIWIHGGVGTPRLRHWCWCERRTGPHEHTGECPQEGQA